MEEKSLLNARERKTVSTKVIQQKTQAISMIAILAI